VIKEKPTLPHEAPARVGMVPRLGGSGYFSTSSVTYWYKIGQIYFRNDNNVTQLF